MVLMSDTQSGFRRGTSGTGSEADSIDGILGFASVCEGRFPETTSDISESIEVYHARIVTVSALDLFCYDGWPE
jgi:hypothetical protein